jgi:hypothetical protein
VRYKGRGNCIAIRDLVIVRYKGRSTYADKCSKNAPRLITIIVNIDRRHEKHVLCNVYRRRVRAL